MPSWKRTELYKELHPESDTVTWTIRKGVFGQSHADIILEPDQIRIVDSSRGVDLLELSLELSEKGNSRLDSLTKSEAGVTTRLFMIDRQLASLTKKVDALISRPVSVKSEAVKEEEQNRKKLIAACESCVCPKKKKKSSNQH